MSCRFDDSRYLYERCDDADRGLTGRWPFDPFCEHIDRTGAGPRIAPILTNCIDELYILDALCFLDWVWFDTERIDACDIVWLDATSLT